MKRMIRSNIFKVFLILVIFYSNLNDLADKGEKGYLALKIVEIIGEDEVNNLDPETIYFITNLLNKLNLTKFRNEILSTALPLRI